ncbi:heme-binding protein [Ochrobactrum vermis]|uniref:Heme-binding protein n=1 Tax=Ochrobactrum vermis TaxID=1827297 RepID=A0ABU8PJE9_9HYPH|nr:heme-binding protein [Ochrobactrum vermis]PQZ27241.1 glcG protein [Ochrobactrum vermis]
MSPRPATILASMITTITLANSASAVDLPTKPYLTLEAARSVVAAAEEEAKTNGWPCVISVVDAEGLPVLTVRMDDASVPAGVELAPEKARTAALFRRESGALEDAINGTRPAAITARGFVLMRGGVPITVDGTIVGAIGVSADTPDHDQQIAKAGAAALTTK